MHAHRVYGENFSTMWFKWSVISEKTYWKSAMANSLLKSSWLWRGYSKEIALRWASAHIISHSYGWLVCLFCSSPILGQAMAHRGIESGWTLTLAWQYLRLQVGPYGSWTAPWGSWKGEVARRWASTSTHIPQAEVSFSRLSIYLWLMIPVLQEVPGDYRCGQLWDSTRGGHWTASNSWCLGPR